MNLSNYSKNHKLGFLNVILQETLDISKEITTAMLLYFWKSDGYNSNTSISEVYFNDILRKIGTFYFHGMQLQKKIKEGDYPTSDDINAYCAEIADAHRDLYQNFRVAFENLELDVISSSSSNLLAIHKAIMTEGEPNEDKPE